MKPDTASPTRSPDNSASLPEAKGRNSRASSSCPSSRTDASWRRERQSSCSGGGGGQASVLPGPVPHGRCTRNVVYYQNRFLVIDSTPAKLASSSAAGGGAHGAVTTTTTTTTETTTTQPAVTRTSGGGASGSGARVAGEADAADRSAAARRKATNVAAATALSSRRQMASILSASSAGYCDADATAPAAPAPATAISAADHGAGGGCSSRTTSSTRNQSNTAHVQEMAACPVTMPDGRGIEIIVSDETGVSHRPDTRTSRVSGKRALLKRVGTVLLDNRMSGKENCQRLLTEHPEEYRVLKRVLNIIFVTVGMALLVSVFVVIVYTAVVGNRSSNDGSSSQAAAEQQSDSNSTVV